MREASAFVVLSVFILLSLSAAAFGAEAPAPASPPPVFTLQEALARAFAQNPMLKAGGMGVEAAEEEIAEARGRLLPKLYIEERWSRTNNPTYAFMSKLNQGGIAQENMSTESLNSPSATSDFQSSINLEQLLFSRQAMLGLSMARTEHEARRLDQVRSGETLALNVIKAYQGVNTARRYVDVAERGLGDANEHHRIATVRLEAGLGKQSDVLRTEVSVREAEEAVLKARKSLELARRTLGLLLGLSSPAEAAEEAPATGPGALSEAGDIEAHLSRLSDRSDLRALSLRVDNADRGVSMATAGYLPTAGLSASWQMNSKEQAFGRDNDSYMVVAFLRWDLFDPGRGARHAQAAAREREAGYMLEAMKQNMQYKVHESYLGLMESSQALELAVSRAALAEETRRIIALRFEGAVATVVELLDAQTALNMARADVVGKENALRVAAAELSYESGRCGAEGCTLSVTSKNTEVISR